MERSAPAESSALDSEIPSDTLEALVTLQAFEGSWAWNGKLFAALGVDEAAAASKIASLFGASSPKTSLSATALVLAFLETRLAAKKDEWEMLADKALAWLASQLKSKGDSKSAEEYVGGAKTVL